MPSNLWPACFAFAAPVLIAAAYPAFWPRWLLMWLLAASIFFGFKVLTWCLAPRQGVPLWRQLAYLFAWPGMDAERFLRPADRPRTSAGSTHEWSRAALNFAVGASLFWTAQHWVPRSSPVALGWAGMIGVVLMLHFGSFQLLSCFWRSLGVDAPPLMNRPLRSTSVTEFWGRRWNTAFRDLTYRFLFRPLQPRVGPRAALLIGFIASGIIHDIVISLPARGGYGGPTLFFAIQPVAILIERSSAGRSLGLMRGWPGWLFTAVALLAPAPLLFHDPFLTRIVLPFMKAFGAA
jgi:alginate O-acetyltransferase complex protein AlgI